jgi:hypothetical protein
VSLRVVRIRSAPAPEGKELGALPGSLSFPENLPTLGKARSRFAGVHKRRNFRNGLAFSRDTTEATMGFGKGALLWLLGIPLPIILLLALFMHH